LTARRFPEPDSLALQPGHFQRGAIEWFFNEFYYPGLLSDIFAGKRPRVAQDVSRKDRRQPIVKLSLAPESAPTSGPATAIASRTVKVRIDVTDAPADKIIRKAPARVMCVCSQWVAA